MDGGTELPKGTAQRLRRLHERRLRLEDEFNEALDELAVAVCQVCDLEGGTRVQVARALGVGTSTVQGWVKRGRQVLERRELGHSG